MEASAAPIRTRTSTGSLGYAHLFSAGTSVNLPAIHTPNLQSKHIVIYDTLINQSTPEEIEAVLGASN